MKSLLRVAALRQFINFYLGEFIVQLITLADFYNVKPLLEKSIDMLKFLPNVSNVEKLRVAIKVRSMSLEVVAIPCCGSNSRFQDVAIASLSKADVAELIAAGFKDLGDDRWQKIVSKCHTVMR